MESQAANFSDFHSHDAPQRRFPQGTQPENREIRMPPCDAPPSYDMNRMNPPACITLLQEQANLPFLHKQ